MEKRHLLKNSLMILIFFMCSSVFADDLKEIPGISKSIVSKRKNIPFIKLPEIEKIQEQEFTLSKLRPNQPHSEDGFFIELNGNYAIKIKEDTLYLTTNKSQGDIHLSSITRKNETHEITSRYIIRALERKNINYTFFKLYQLFQEKGSVIEKITATNRYVNELYQIKLKKKYVYLQVFSLSKDSVILWLAVK